MALRTPHYQLDPANGGWRLSRLDGSELAMFANRSDAERVLVLLERSEPQTKSLIDTEAAKKEFDAAMSCCGRRDCKTPIVSGYDHQLDD